MDFADKYEIAIIGGGMSGCILASLLDNKNVCLLEMNSRLMDKIYATGNGRCNLTNININTGCYHTEDGSLLNNILKRYDNIDFINYLESIGLFTRDIEGYVYPINFEASSVVEAIENRVYKNVDVKLNFKVEKIKIGDIYKIYSGDKIITCKKIILATGGIASKYYKSDISPYKFLPIKITPILPALCALKVDKKYFKELAGVRVNARSCLIIEDKVIDTEIGQIQFKKDFLSGIQIFQHSIEAIKALKANKKVYITLDYIYDKNKEDIKEMLLKNGLDHLKFVLPKKLAKIAIYLASRKNQDEIMKINSVMNIITSHKINIVGYDEYNNAQTTSGGYKLSELNQNLESNMHKNMYIVGEVLDVTGKCGGYNIQWCYTSAKAVSEKILNE